MWGNLCDTKTMHHHRYTYDQERITKSVTPIASNSTGIVINNNFVGKHLALIRLLSHSKNSIPACFGGLKLLVM